MLGHYFLDIQYTNGINSYEGGGKSGHGRILINVQHEVGLIEALILYKF